MGKECCAARRKERTGEEYVDLIHRLNRIEGQIRGLRKMIEDNAYCTDILTQSAAAGAALDAFNRCLLEEHIRSCVSDDIREGNNGKTDELIDILKKLMR